MDCDLKKDSSEAAVSVMEDAQPSFERHFVMIKAPLFLSQAPRPSTGPHKLRECLPLIIFLRNRLKYALTGDEVKKICMQRFIKIDGKVRTDVTYPAGFMGESTRVFRAALIHRKLWLCYEEAEGAMRIV